jgi:hypothetical protein
MVVQLGDSTLTGEQVKSSVMDTGRLAIVTYIGQLRGATSSPGDAILASHIGGTWIPLMRLKKKVLVHPQHSSSSSVFALWADLRSKGFF